MNVFYSIQLFTIFSDLPAGADKNCFKIIFDLWFLRYQLHRVVNLNLNELEISHLDLEINNVKLIPIFELSKDFN